MAGNYIFLSDAALLKSLEQTMSEDMVNKALGRDNLVPKEVMITRGGKTYQQTVWVDPNKTKIGLKQGQKVHTEEGLGEILDEGGGFGDPSYKVKLHSGDYAGREFIYHYSDVNPIERYSPPIEVEVEAEANKPQYAKRDKNAPPVTNGKLSVDAELQHYELSQSANGYNVLKDGKKVARIIKISKHGFSYWKVAGTTGVHINAKEALRSYVEDQLNDVKYTVVMEGITGAFKTEYGSKEKADQAAKNIQGLGYEAKVIPSKPNTAIKPSTASKASDDLGKYKAILEKDGKEAVMTAAKKDGIQWKEHENPGINWMRAIMAIKQYMNGGNSNGKGKSGKSEGTTDKQHPGGDNKGGNKEQAKGDVGGGSKETGRERSRRFSVIGVDMMETRDNQGFHDAIVDAKKNNPYSAFVDAHSAEEYAAKKLFLTADSTAGVAVSEDGDIVSVFKNTEKCQIKGVSSALLLTALENGGKKLDCYDSPKHGLPILYARLGFIPVCKLKFDRQFAAPDWNYDRDGEPDLVFFRHNGDSTKDILKNSSSYKLYTSYDNLPYAKDYEAAQKMRDAAMKEPDTDQSDSDLGKYKKLLTSEGKAAVILQAKKDGIQWKEHENPGINWMRAVMAIKKQNESGIENDVTQVEKDANSKIYNPNKPPKTWKQLKFKVAIKAKTKKGKSLEVKNVEIIGLVKEGLAVHRNIIMGDDGTYGAKGSSYAITHAPSGLKITEAKSLSAGKHIADKIIEAIDTTLDEQHFTKEFMENEDLKAML